MWFRISQHFVAKMLRNCFIANMRFGCGERRFMLLTAYLCLLSKQQWTLRLVLEKTILKYCRQVLSGGGSGSPGVKPRVTGLSLARLFQTGYHSDPEYWLICFEDGHDFATALPLIVKKWRLVQEPVSHHSFSSI